MGKPEIPASRVDRFCLHQVLWPLPVPQHCCCHGATVSVPPFRDRRGAMGDTERDVGQSEPCSRSNTLAWSSGDALATMPPRDARDRGSPLQSVITPPAS